MGLEGLILTLGLGVGMWLRLGLGSGRDSRTDGTRLRHRVTTNGVWPAIVRGTRRSNRGNGTIIGRYGIRMARLRRRRRCTFVICCFKQ